MAENAEVREDSTGTDTEREDRPEAAGAQREGIVNLTNFDATEVQKEAGVRDVDEGRKGELKEALLFRGMPTMDEIREHAETIAGIAEQSGAEKAMITGAPYLMAPLEQALLNRGIEPVYAYSPRVSVEVQKEDGTVEKTFAFEHRGFLMPFSDPAAKNLIDQRADALAQEAKTQDGAEGIDRAMIGGAPYLMSSLERALENAGITPEYAFTERNVSGDTRVFEHLGFLPVTDHPDKGEKILNLTQHNGTESQAAAGLVEPEDKKAIQSELTFTDSDFAGVLQMDRYPVEWLADYLVEQVKDTEQGETVMDVKAETLMSVETDQGVEIRLTVEETAVEVEAVGKDGESETVRLEIEDGRLMIREDPARIEAVSAKDAKEALTELLGGKDARVSLHDLEASKEEAPKEVDKDEEKTSLDEAEERSPDVETDGEWEGDQDVDAETEEDARLIDLFGMDDTETEGLEGSLVDAVEKDCSSDSLADCIGKILGEAEEDRPEVDRSETDTDHGTEANGSDVAETEDPDTVEAEDTDLQEADHVDAPEEVDGFPGWEWDNLEEGVPFD